MEKKLRLLLAIVVLAVLLAGMGSSVSLADSGHSEYVYLIGASSTEVPLCSLDPSACPDVAMAPNGNIIDFSGMGTLNVNSKSVTGGGSYTHHFGGSFAVHGTWTAEKLVSFVEYGCEDLGFPVLACGGQALIKVHIVADGGLFEGDGFLQVDSKIAGFPQSGAGEGVRLLVPGIVNFNQEVSGLTVFYPLP